MSSGVFQRVFSGGQGHIVSPSRRRIGTLLLLPLVFAVLFFAAYPAAYLVLTSISKSTMGRPFISWVGINNFVSALQGDFAWSLVRTALFAIPTSVVQLVLGVAIAILLNAKMRFRSLWRTLLLLPLMSPPVMVRVAWKVMLHPTGGFVSRALSQFGWLHAPSSFLGEMPWAILSIAAADTWQWTPFVIILVYAALSDVASRIRRSGPDRWSKPAKDPLSGATPFVGARPSCHLSPKANSFVQNI
jgi:multiple sugar transport system permease protein